MLRFTYKMLLLSFYLLVSTNVFSQFTGIGSHSPHASSLLDMNVSSLPVNGKKGFLSPRLTLLSNTDVVSIPSPVKGLWVYSLLNSGIAPSNIYGGFTYFWNGSIWDYYSSRDEIIALKIPVTYVLSSKTATATPALTTIIVPISWATGEVILDNPDIIEATLPTTSFKIKKAGLFEFTGSFSYNPHIAAERNETTFTLALQVSTNSGGTWTTFAGAQNVIGHGEVNTIQSFPIPPNLYTFAVNDLVRLVVVNPVGVTHGAAAAIESRLSTYITKSLRTTYIAQ